MRKDLRDSAGLFSQNGKIFFGDLVGFEVSVGNGIQRQRPAVHALVVGVKIEGAVAFVEAGFLAEIIFVAVPRRAGGIENLVLAERNGYIDLLAG